MNLLRSYLRKLNHQYYRLSLFFLKSKNDDGVVYLWKRRNSKGLIIVFTAISNSEFNYVKALKNSPYDQLFIKDCWSGGVSYYWYENKLSYPETYTQKLIQDIVVKGGYESIYTVGSSKGGSAALYYGLLNKVNMIYVGACQYYVGNYLAFHQYVEHPEQWRNMVGGEPEKEWIDILNNKIPDLIENFKGEKTKIKILYSTKEHTYPEHIRPLINKLDENGIKHEDQIEDFESHSMIGEYFKVAINQFFTKSVI